MATTSKLILKFETMGGQKTWSFANMNPEVTTAKVKGLMDTMITNGSIYKYPPLAKVSAVMQTVTENDYDLS